MKLKLKTFGLVVVLTMAASAVAASGAQAAAKFMTQEGAAKNVNAELVGQAVNIFHSFTVEDEKKATKKLVCETATFATSGEIGFPREEVTLLPTYGKCKFNGVANVTADLNGCDYDLLNNIFAGGAWHGDLSLTCPVGKSIQFTISIEGKVACTLTVLPKEKVAGVTIENIATTGVPPTGGDLLVKTKNVGFEAIYDPEILNGCTTFGTGKGTAAYEGETTLQAKHLGNLVDLTME